jgi:hypothetical protein
MLIRGIDTLGGSDRKAIVYIYLICIASEGLSAAREADTDQSHCGTSYAHDRLPDKFLANMQQKIRARNDRVTIKP